MGEHSKAEEVFKHLPQYIKNRVFEIAEGKLIYFPKLRNKKRIVDRNDVIVNYAKGKSCNKIGVELGISRVRAWQIINRERNHFSEEKVDFWKNKGLSLREIARLFKKSHESIQQINKWIKPLN